MHIVTASDRNYLPGVLVLIASAARHNPGARFSVLAVDWTADDLDRLVALARHLDVQITALPLGKEAFGTLRTGRKHLTIAAFSRLLIPDLMPDEDRVLYMDCDMVVTGGLREVWDANLDGYLLGAVACPSPGAEALHLLNLRAGDYINSGFLLMNLALWRAEDVAKQCLATLTKTPEKVLTCDEVAINHFCAGRILYLPCIYNIYATQFIHDTQLCPPEDIRVLHFTVGKKPWLRPNAFSPVWYFEAERIAEATGISATPPRHGPRDWLRLANQQRKLWQARLSAGRSRQRYLRQNAPFMDWIDRYTARM